LEKALVKLQQEQVHNHSHSHAHSRVHSRIHTPMIRSRAASSIAVLPAEARADIIRVADTLHEAADRLKHGDVEAGHAHDHHHHHNEEEHSHKGFLNMRGVFLHVLGDALGNIAVIVSALIIWLATGWETRFYVDPIISVLITTLIIFFSIPLVRSAAYILVQGVPDSVSIENVRKDILKVDGVLSVHDLHVWQLSDTELVASIHILISSKAKAMTIQRNVQKVMIDHGITLVTIQPEIWRKGSHSDTPDDEVCLLACVDEEEDEEEDLEEVHLSINAEQNTTIGRRHTLGETTIN